jgi:flagellar protein FlaG
MSLSVTPLKVDRPFDKAAAEAAVAKPASSPDSPPQVAAQAAAARTDNMEQAKAMREQLQQTLAEMNQQMRLNGRALAFSMDEKADRMVIKVSNSITGEVVRQIPNEVVLRIAHSIEEFKGVLHDQAT